MKTIDLTMNTYEFTFQFENLKTPLWSDRVDRWYQLDGAAYGLVAAYFHLRSQLLKKPSLMILASPAASNDTDLDFARTGAMSPSRFVHTLPNIRSAPLLQLMEWSGPLLCLQSAAQTQVAGLVEATGLVTKSCPRCWIWSVLRLHKMQYRVQLFEMTLPEAGHLYGIYRNLEDGGTGVNSHSTDRDLHDWMRLSKNKDAPFLMAENLFLMRL